MSTPELGGESHPSTQTLEAVAQELRARVKGRVATREPVARLVSFRVGGPAAVFFEPKDAGDLASAGEVLGGYGLKPLVIGRGTNLLVSDEGYPGVVVRLGKSFDWIKADDQMLEAGAATPLPQVSNKAARLSLEGLEFAIAIPAAVGGAVRMNAGAHGSSISEVLEAALICDLAEGALKSLGPTELQMRYRETSLGAHQVVCSARFRLRKGDRKEIAARMNDYRAHRADTQQADAPNAGSMFRNPPGDTAGRLIETAELKGLSVGAAEVSRKHANFFLAHQGATAQQIYDLMAHVQKKVLEVHGTLLIPEVKIAGPLDTSAGLRISE